MLQAGSGSLRQALRFLADSNMKGRTKVHLLYIYTARHGIIVDPGTVFLGFSLDHRIG